MSRLPRRPLRVKPPLRGRAATRQYRGEFAPVASVRRPSRPYSSARTPLTSPYKEPKPPIVPPGDTEPPITHPHTNGPHTHGIYADLVELYKSWGRFLQTLGKPWNWLLVLAIVLSSLLLLNRFL